jgi:manganese efflux pump family protein
VHLWAGAKLSCDHGRVPLKLLALILPLSLDTFAVSAALGVAGVSGRERWRLSLIMSAFEMVMPIAGFAAGGLLSQALGDLTDYLAAAVLAGTGLLFLREDPSEEGPALARRMRGPAAIGVGLSVSLDELAIGFVIGLLGLPALAVALLVGAQALLASQLGLRLGARLGERLGERAEQAAGLLLVAMGLALAASRASGHPI